MKNSDPMYGASGLLLTGRMRAGANAESAGEVTMEMELDARQGGEEAGRRRS